MPTLSSQYAFLVTESGLKALPSEVSVTVDETSAPYVSASVTVPRNDWLFENVDPREGDRITLHMQQDFGDLVYIYELTADFTGDVSNVTAGISPLQNDTFTRRYTKPWNIFEAGLPLSTLTALYGGSVHAMTVAGLVDIWRITKLLHAGGSFNPAPSTVFNGNLGVREVVEDFIANTFTIELASDEALAQDRYGFGSTTTPQTFGTLRSAVEYLLFWAGAQHDGKLWLDPDGGDFTLATPYSVPIYANNVSKNLWDELLALVNSCGFTLWCDETRLWHLKPSAATAGSLALKDNDNVTAFSRTTSRNEKWFSDVVLEYATQTDWAYNGVTPPFSRRFLYLDRKESATIEANGATTLLARAGTRGQTFDVEAISNFDARPRQTITTDVSGIPLMSGIVQSVTWQLPAARMSIKLRDLALI